ncbi:unnamed protein product [Oikopleura dioica]|uniref:C-type lectin domain-containing protein n=1 Tax=Oikopleura dioica TaxID=34765 RepID=E4YWQ9_OIKDI|nr:unnamed protein product [Oikopleura dioica]
MRLSIFFARLGYLLAEDHAEHDDEHEITSCQALLEQQNSEQVRQCRRPAEDWVVDKNGHCVKVFLTHKSWNDALECCKKKGGKLVTIEYPAKAFEVKYLLQKASNWTEDQIWLGYNDKENEGVWMGCNGKPAPAGFWHKNQPDNCCRGRYGIWEQNCALMGSRGYVTWEDQCCKSERHPFACQIENCEFPGDVRDDPSGTPTAEITEQDLMIPM